MRKKTLMVATMLMLVVTGVYAQGINFVTDLSWAQIQEKARSEKKLILIDAYTTWCVPCREMSEKTFPVSEVGDAVNEKFVALKVQMDQTGKDSDQVKAWHATAKQLMDKYEVNAFPTILFLTPEGKLVHSLVGFADAPALITEVKKALARNGEYGQMISKFDKGGMDTAGMQELVKKARELKDRATMIRVSDAYIKQIKPADLLKKSNLLFAGSNLHSKGRYYELFKTKAKEINIIIAKNYAEQVLKNVIYREEIAPFDKAEKPDWDAIEKRVSSKHGRLGEEQAWGNRTVYYWQNKDWVNFGKYYKKYFDRVIPLERSGLHINNMSWPVFEHVTDSAILNTAIKAMAYNVDKFQRYDAPAIDTYANLLYKANLLYGAGKKEDALFWAELGVRLTDHDKGFEETLAKMKRGEKTW